MKAMQSIIGCMRRYPKSLLAGSSVMAIMGRIRANNACNYERLQDPSQGVRIPQLKTDQQVLWTGRILTILGLSGMVATFAACAPQSRILAASGALTMGGALAFAPLFKRAIPPYGIDVWNMNPETQAEYEKAEAFHEHWKLAAYIAGGFTAVGAFGVIASLAIFHPKP